MDDLEKVFRDNQASFDRITTDKDLWSPIKQSLATPIIPIERASKSNRRWWLMVAASIVLLVAVSAYWFIHTDSPPRFENLAMAAPDGKEVVFDPSLNKYTLIQFWASGNVLCDKQNCYYYLPAYKKYKDRGFEIYAISLDLDKREWMQSIEENDLPWIHVSDLKGWESPVCIECDITKIPTAFLLDQKGNIILEDVNAEMLDKTLSTLLADNGS